jgi:transcriptional antiterminator NusG
MTEETKEAFEEVETQEEVTESASSAVATEAEVDEDQDPALAAGNSPEFKWYIAKTLTGQENKIAKTLRERVINLKKSEFVSKIVVPEETVTSNAGGKKRTIKKRFFPGYILLKMIMNNDTWHLVKDTDKVTGFVGGTPDKPQAITDEEAAYMLGKGDQGVKKIHSGVNFHEGDQVKVVEGPFASFVGTIEAVNDKGKIKVNVSIFGRPTPVELDFSQVEKVS